MKKTKLFGLLALASCVSLMSACDLSSLKFWEKKEEKNSQKEDDKKDDEEKKEEKATALVVADFQPEFEVGDVINLEDYVTVTPATRPFTVTVASDSSSKATVSGHKLTITGAGEIKFTVKADELSKDCKVDAVAEHLSRAFIREFLGTLGRNYAVNVTDYDNTEKDYVTMSKVYHGANYVMDTRGAVDESKNYVSTGLARFSSTDEKCYYFNMPEGNTDSENIEISERLGISYFNEYNPESLSVDFSKAVYEYDATYGESYYLEGDDAIKFAEEALFLMGGSFGNYRVSDVEFQIYDFSEEEAEEPDYRVCAVPHIVVGTETYYLGYDFFQTEASQAQCQLLEEYCVPEHRPASSDYFNDFLSNEEYFSSEDPFFDRTLGDLLLSPSGVYGPVGVIEVDANWYDYYTDEVTEAPSFESSFFGGILPHTSATYFTDADSIWNVNAVYEEEELVGYVPVSGLVEVSSSVYNTFYNSVSGFTALPNEDGLESAWDVKEGATDVTVSEFKNPDNWSEDTVYQHQVGELYGEGISTYALYFDALECHAIVEALSWSLPGLELFIDTVDYWAVDENDPWNMLENGYLTLYFTPELSIVNINYQQFGFGATYYQIDVTFTANASVSSLTSAWNTAVGEVLAA